jgi:hypothetical protein
MASDDAAMDPGTLAEAACHKPFGQAWAEVQTSLRASVLQTLRNGAEQHRELIASQGLDEPAPPEWKVRAERLLEYRTVVDRELLKPLARLFAEGGPTTTIESALVAAREKGGSLCRALPAEVPTTWPEGALDTKPTDPFGRRFGKVFARRLSKARKAGRDRTLPLRSAVVRHFDRVVIPGQDEIGAAALTSWGTWSHELELSLVRWGAVALPALIRAERPEQTGEDDADSGVWAAVREAAEALQSSLDALVEESPEAEATTAAHATLGASRGVLEADLAVAGSVLYKPSETEGAATFRDLPSRAAALRDWDVGIGARIQLYSSLLGILSGATAVRRRTVWRFRDDCLSSVSELTGIAAKLEDLRAELIQPGDYGLRSRLSELDAAVATALEAASGAIPGKAAVDSALLDLSDTTIDALLGMIGQAPAALEVHDLAERGPLRGRKVERRPLPLQELARHSFDALRIERIRSSTSGLVDAIDAVRTDVTELEGVYSFARDEALRELESSEEGSGDRADDLIGGALHSIAEALRAQVVQLDTAVANAQRRLAGEISDGSMALVDRVEAGRMGARLFAARSRMADLWTLARDRWGPPVERAWRRIVLQVVRLRRIGARVLRKGSAMVGSAPPAAASSRTLRALADASIEGLPLVYQRLFTLEPITDPALLAGRQADLDQALGYWKRWHDDDGVPLIVLGRQRSGITSFLNVFTAEIQKGGGSVVRAALKDRIGDEASLTEHLATLLGLPPTDSLAHLSASIFEVSPSALPAAISLDNLEHLYLRVPKGTDLIERLLTLMAETEPRLFWIGGMTTSAWKLVSTAEPTAVSQVEVFDLESLDAQAMRAAIMVRHRRSGLAIRYEEPTGGMHRLRQRLRRTRDAEAYQANLEEEFFERLYRTSGGYLGLALYQWLKAADFTSGDGVLMRQPERPDFSVLDALDLTQNFTLKAFLEHRSLTLEEHDRIFRTTRQESYQIFESLRNRHLLEPLTSEPAVLEERSEIEVELRYRVRPLLTGAVIAHLQGRNIVH